MCDDNREVDEQFEQLRVGKPTVGATRGFVYKVSDTSRVTLLVVCECETCLRFYQPAL